jgi:ketosteroid isomerase-like protein
MKRLFTITTMLATLAISAAAQCSDADRKALEAFDRAWGAASTSGDRAALTGIYADDYTGLPGYQAKGPAIDDAVKAAERNRANPNADKVTHEHYRISCTPTSAVITHRNTIWTADGPAGKPGSFYTRSIHFLEKRNGKWQVVSNAGGGPLDDYATIWYLEQDWNDAVWKKDKAWFDSNYASDFTSISGSSATLMDKAQDIADTIDPKTTFDMVETTDMNIRIDGDKAIVTGVFHTKGKGADGPFDRKVRYTDVWIKRDGRWVAWSSQGTMMK